MRAAIDCLYDPHVSNPECMYLVILASTKLEGGSWSSLIPYAMRALTDYPQACQCVRGASTSAAFQAVPQSCAAQDTLELLRALETSCAFEPQIQASMSKALQGCSDADIVRSELVGVQLMDCLGAGGSELAGSSELLTEGRISQLANCVHDPDYSNPDCLALLGSLAKAAAQQPESVEAQLVDRMGQDGKGFCGCVDAAAKSAPAQGIAPTCASPYEGVQFLRNNKDKCEMIAAVPPSFWSTTAAAIAAAASKAGVSVMSSAPTPGPATVVHNGYEPAATSVEASAGDAGAGVVAVAVKGDGSWWDYVPEWEDLPTFPTMQSMLSYFADVDAEAAARRLGTEAEEREHTHLRFKGTAARQRRQQD